MKKIFSIEYGDGIGDLGEASVKFYLEEGYKDFMYKFKVRELSQEQCECKHNFDAGSVIFVDDVKKMICSNCKKTIKLIKPQEKIKKIWDRGHGKLIVGYNLKRTEKDIIDIVNKINEIIAHLNRGR